MHLLSLDTGWAKIIVNSGPDTVSVCVTRDEGQLFFALTESEAIQMAAALTTFVAQKDRTCTG